ncbi:MAG: tetratricopeptide repeat protein [Planctomycetota bacterium]
MASSLATAESPTTHRRASIAVAAIVALVYARGLGSEFVYDDLALIVQNPSLHDPTDVFGLWSRPLWGEQLGHWRPLTAQLLAIGWWLAQGSAVGIHALSLLLHVSAFFGAVRLCRELDLAPAAALGAALPFALHPCNAEAVAWAAALNDVLGGTCAIHGLAYHLGWRRTGERRSRALALLFAALAMLSKESFAVVPLLYLASDLALRRSVSSSWRAAVAPLVLVLLWLIARMLVFGELTAGFGRTTFAQPGSELGNAAAVAGGLLQHLLWPVGLGMFEPLALSPGALLHTATTLLAVGIAWRRREPALRLASLLVAASVVPPMLTVPNLGPYPIADRYLYLATLGLALAFAQVLGSERRGRVLLVVFVALPWATATFLRLPLWRDQATFVERSLAQQPMDPRLHYMHGAVLLERAERGTSGAAAAAAEAFARARSLLGNDLRRRDHQRQLRRDVAIALAWCTMREPSADGMPDWLRVEREFLVVTQEWPDAADGFVGLGVARAASGRLPLAELDLRRAIAIDPGTSAAHHNLARVLYARGDKSGAKEHLLLAVSIRSDDLASRALLEQLEREGVR